MILIARFINPRKLYKFTALINTHVFYIDIYSAIKFKGKIKTGKIYKTIHTYARIHASYILVKKRKIITSI